MNEVILSNDLKTSLRETNRSASVDNMDVVEHLFNSDDSDDDIEETILDSDETANVYDPKYDGPCSIVIQKLLKLDEEEFVELAVFIPINKFEKFKKYMENLGYPLLDEHLWDYDLRIDDTIKPVKLIWLQEHQVQAPIILPRKTKKAFRFLQPDYLRYMDKPLWNPGRTFIQVNLMLDYHRTQKRRRGIETFNVCDLIAFKMAIDDNRLEYENCEFHKIINRTLAEYVQSGTYMKDGKFDLREYIGFTQDYRAHYSLRYIFEYLVYHFEKIIESIYFEEYCAYPIKLSNVTNISVFLERINLAPEAPTILVRETDSSGKCLEILYEILTRAERLHIIFDMDCEWIYSTDFVLNNETIELGKINIEIHTKNSFNFIENFINWLKFAFGTKSVDLTLKNFEKIHPYVLHDFHLNQLTISGKLGYKLVKMLQMCNYKLIYLENCRIENDIKQNFGLIGHRTESDRNVFRLIDQTRKIQNYHNIDVMVEEHTIGTLFAYVASVMTEKKLMEFQLIKALQFSLTVGKKSIRPLFRRSNFNHVIEQIEVFSEEGDRIDMYEFLNEIDPIDREEFDFYQ